MPAPKSYTKAQWDEFVRLLSALPEKPPSEQRVTVRDAMPKVRAHINAARRKGYSVEQLTDQAKQELQKQSGKLGVDLNDLIGGKKKKAK